MGICTDCGRNDQEPLAACPKCTLGEQGDSDLPVIDDLRRQLAAVTAERDRLRTEFKELRAKLQAWMMGVGITLEVAGAVDTEREACALVAESMPDGMWQHGLKIAAAIRARGGA